VLPPIALCLVALWTIWRPAETTVATPVVLALAVLVLVPWAHSRTEGRRLFTAIAVSGLAVAAAAFSAAGGWDRAAAVVELALAAAIVSFAWIASRERVSRILPGVLAAGIALLALWALWQVGVGFGRAEAAVAALPPALQANAAERLGSGRAFASLLLPGHLAVLFATALPLLMASIRRGRQSAPWAIGAGLCVLGLVLTRSPIGIGLAVVAMVVLLVRRRNLAMLAGVGILAAVLFLAVVWRPDVGELDPVRLRMDNWQTAAWAWSTSPVAGVGLGSFGQATRAVPFEVGNLPAHAHSLPMEWAAELGLVGVLACVVGAIWLVNLLRRLWPSQPELAVGLSIVPLHNLVDFSLYTSGVAIPWAILVGWGMAAVGREERRTGGAKSRIVLVTLAAVAVAGSLLHATSVTLERAALSSEAARQRYADAALAHRIAPWRIDPLPLAAAAALESGDPRLLGEASDLVTAGRRLRPRSATLAEASGRMELALGGVPSGAAELWSAARWQPAAGDRAASWKALLQQLEARDARASR